MPRTRTVLFGGSFDPPHRGHIQVAKAILAANLTDEVWFVPCGGHPFGRTLSAAVHRIAMLRLMLEPKMSICEYETNKSERTYSIDTLDALTTLYPKRTFSWLMGSDQLPSFHAWKEQDHLLQTYAVYVYPRRGHPLSAAQKGMIPLSSLPEIDVSSTSVRQALQSGSVVTHLDPDVTAYIQTHALYAPPHAPTV